MSAVNPGRGVIPVLTGDRVILRGMTWADFPDFSEMWADPELTRFLPFAPVERGVCWARMNRIFWHWAHYGFGNLAVVSRDDGRFLGQVGLFHADRRLGEDFDLAPEGGWVLARHARGLGLATEAMALVHDWFDANDAGGRTVCMMDPEHESSIRVAEKCGYRLLRVVKDEWGPLRLMVRGSG